MGKFGSNLPSVLNPLGEICVQVYIPAHPDYVKLFVRAVRMLEVQRMYARDETMEGAKIVVEQWRDRTITPLIDALANGTGLCQDLGGDCLTYPPFASFVTYYPQNPYTEPDLVPEGFEEPPFYINGKDASHDLPNYEQGDVLVSFGALNIEPSWDLSKTPRIELCLEGSGILELHLLAIAQGGVAIVSLDNPVDLGDIIAGIVGEGIEIIDLNQDVVSLPPETAEEIIIELEVPTEGEHVVYIYYFPQVNDSILFVGFGGGLRSIELCGNLRPCGTPAPPPPPPLEGVTELKPEFQFTADCGMEYRLRDQENNIVQDWTPVAGWVDNAELCFGSGDMATVEEICEGVSCAIEKAAVAIIQGYKAGAVNDINIGYDGNTTVTPPGSAPDDTATTADEEARSGGANGIRLGINLIWGYLNTWYTAGNTTLTAEAKLNDLFILDDTKTADLVAGYWATRDATDPYYLVFPVEFDSYMYCKGKTAQVMRRWAYTVVTTSLQAMALDLINTLTQEQIDLWYNTGKLTPSTDYVDYSCSKTPSETILVPIDSNTFYAGVQTWKANHRVRMTVDEFFTDPQGDIIDFCWNKQVGLAPTFKNNDVMFRIGTTEQVDLDATTNEVPYSTNHAYTWTGVLANTGIMSIRINRGTGIDVSTTGTFSVLIEDLGEIVT